jgi:hypothetical protein
LATDHDQHAQQRHPHDGLAVGAVGLEGQQHQGHEDQRVVGDVDHRRAQQCPLRDDLDPVGAAAVAGDGLVVADVVGHGEAGGDGHQADAEHEERGPVTHQQHDGRREQDEADVHDVGQGHHRGLVARRLLDLRPVQHVGQPEDGQQAQADGERLITVAPHRVTSSRRRRRQRREGSCCP